MLIRIILVALCCAIPIYSQTLERYSFRREVTIQTLKGNKVTSSLVRQSFFTFDDRGFRIESEVQESGKSKLNLSEHDWQAFQDAQILDHFPPVFSSDGNIWTNATKRATWWTNEASTVRWVTERPWFAEKVVSGLRFPARAGAEGTVRGRAVRVLIRYWDWRLFRTSVVIKDVDQ